MIIFLCGKIEKVTLASITGLLSHCYNVSTLVKSHLFELITYNVHCVQPVTTSSQDSLNKTFTSAAIASEPESNNP